MVTGSGGEAGSGVLFTSPTPSRSYSLLSGAGDHQFCLPSRAIRDGTSSDLTMKASIRQWPYYPQGYIPLGDVRHDLLIPQGWPAGPSPSSPSNGTPATGTRCALFERAGDSPAWRECARGATGAPVHRSAGVAAVFPNEPEHLFCNNAVNERDLADAERPAPGMRLCADAGQGDRQVLMQDEWLQRAWEILWS